MNLRIIFRVATVLQCFFMINTVFAAEANLVFVRLSRIVNPAGGFAGMPGGGNLGDDPTCKLLSGLSLKKLKFENDESHHRKKLKSRVTEVFRSEFMSEVVDRVVETRKLAYPKITDQDARTIHVVINDCTFDAIKTGPAVFTMKGTIKSTFKGKPLNWVLMLNDAGWAQIDELFSKKNVKGRIPDDVLAHELTHAITADVLLPATIVSSNKQKHSTRHDVGLISDASMAFWEGLAEGVEATIGETLDGAFSYPYSMDPGNYGLLLERQRPVRNNAFIYYPNNRDNQNNFGELKSPRDLLASEGFIATYIYRLLTKLPYSLSNGAVLSGWPFMELVATIKETQPSNTIELLRGIFSREKGGHEAMLDFMEISYFSTYGEDAYEFSNEMRNIDLELQELTSKLRVKPDNPILMERYKNLLARQQGLENQWSEKKRGWIEELNTDESADPLRFAKKLARPLQ